MLLKELIQNLQEQQEILGDEVEVVARDTLGAVCTEVRTRNVKMGLNFSSPWAILLEATWPGKMEENDNATQDFDHNQAEPAKAEGASQA